MDLRNAAFREVRNSSAAAMVVAPSGPSLLELQQKESDSLEQHDYPMEELQVS